MNKFLNCIIFIILLIASTNSLAASQLSPITNDTIQPEYPGGINALRNFISKNLRHPIISQIEGKESGLVKIHFTVDTLGNITQPKILQTIDRYYATEALRVLSLTKQWSPGTINGKKVKVAYTLPIRFHKNELSLQDAIIIINGELINKEDILNHISSNFTPYNYFPKDVTKALLGTAYNNTLITIQNPNFIKKSSKELSKTLHDLKNIDTTKFKLLIDNREVKYPIWFSSLNTDSTDNVLIHKVPQDTLLFGAVNLLTKTKNMEYRNNYYRNEANMQTFINLVNKYRRNEIPLTNQLVYIDNNHYGTKWIMDSLDLSIIKHIRITNPEEVLNKFQDPRKNGFIQIYTEDYSMDQETKFLNKLKVLLEEYSVDKTVNDNYYIFINNYKSTLEQVSSIPSEKIKNVHIITKTRAKELFGDKEDKPIIYIRTN